jgi:hypothetical protein
MKYRYLLCIFLLAITLEGLSQKRNWEKDELKKNSLFGTLGYYPEGMYTNITGNYERLIVEFPESFFRAVHLRVGGGPWVAWMADGVNFFAVTSLLMGRSGSHLETGMGVLFTYHPDRREWHPIVNDRHLAGNLGYRFQRPGGEFVWRAGLGWPEGFYLSLGWCF